MSIFSDRLRELRGSESQSSFAKQLGLNTIQYSKYERGVNNPSIEVLERICRIHACSSDWLLGIDRKSSTAIANGNGAIAVAGSHNSFQVGEDYRCVKCPYKRKLKAFEKLLNK